MTSPWLLNGNQQVSPAFHRRGGQTVYRRGNLKDRCEPILLFEQLNPIFAQHHETLISEEMWIEAAAGAVKDMGAEKFLRLLLENLKGNCVAS
ncbi:MAG: hypothetical protein JOZ14_00325 [Acidobacteria bacterium]|nr:hypothetical protein [Acidobacteriota bacterium]